MSSRIREVHGNLCWILRGALQLEGLEAVLVDIHRQLTADACRCHAGNVTFACGSIKRLLLRLAHDGGADGLAAVEHRGKVLRCAPSLTFLRYSEIAICRG